MDRPGKLLKRALVADMQVSTLQRIQKAPFRFAFIPVPECVGGGEVIGTGRGLLSGQAGFQTMNRC